MFENLIGTMAGVRELKRNVPGVFDEDHEWEGLVVACLEAEYFLP